MLKLGAIHPQLEDFHRIWSFEIYSFTYDALCIWTVDCSVDFLFLDWGKEKKGTVVVFKVLHHYSVRHAFLFDNSF